MKKIKTTKKEINARYKKVIRVGYCELQTLLQGIAPTSHNAGIYGWNWDCIEINSDIAVVTGYRNLTGKRLPDNKTAEFEQKAEKINQLHNWKQEETERKKLITEFINFIDKNYNQF